MTRPTTGSWEEIGFVPLLSALGGFALMVGTLQVSRALADRSLADALLEQGNQNALALLGKAEPRIR